MEEIAIYRGAPHKPWKITRGTETRVFGNNREFAVREAQRMARKLSIAGTPVQVWLIADTTERVPF